MSLGIVSGFIFSTFATVICKKAEYDYVFPRGKELLFLLVIFSIEEEKCHIIFRPLFSSEDKIEGRVFEIGISVHYFVRPDGLKCFTKR